MLDNYDEMSTLLLKAECKKKGLDFKNDNSGRKIKEVLIERLRGKESDDSGEDESSDLKSVNELKSDILIATEKDIKQYSENKYSEYDAYLNSSRLESLNNQMVAISAGKGEFKIVVDKDRGYFQLEMTGGAPGPNSTTLIDSDQTILRVARQYFTSRMARGGNGQTSVSR